MRIYMCIKGFNYRLLQDKNEYPVSICLNNYILNGFAIIIFIVIITISYHIYLNKLI